MPVLKKYLPAYQTPELMEELKEHERMRLIREREARRWTALNALRGTRDSSPFSAKSRDRTSRDTWVSATRSTEGNSVHLLPYQEMQTFKDVLRELRNRVAEASEQPLIPLSQRADKCKDSKQLFPSKSEGRGGVTTTTTMTTSKFGNRLEPMSNEHKETCGTSCREGQRFHDESFGETASYRSYFCKNDQSGVSTSVDESTDNNDIIS